MPSVRVVFNNQEIQNLPLTKEVYTIGRHEACDIRIDNLGISRNHARLKKEGGGYCVEDLNSANGTFVNGAQVQRHMLGEGDVVAIGKFEIFFSADAAAAAGSGAAETAAAPAAAPAAGHPAMDSNMDMSGNLNTMAMDSDAIRKQIDSMKERDTQQVDKGGPRSPGGKAPAPAPKKVPERESGVTTAKMELRARETEITMLRKDLRTARVLVFVVALIGAAAVAATYYFMKNGG